MSDIVIQAESLGKKYTIGHQTSNGRYMALRDVWMHCTPTASTVAKQVLNLPMSADLRPPPQQTIIQVLS